MQTEAELKIVSKYFYWFGILDIQIKYDLERLGDATSKSSIMEYEGKLKQYKESYRKACMEFEQLPKNLKNHPWLAETKDTIDRRVELLHL